MISGNDTLLQRVSFNWWIVLAWQYEFGGDAKAAINGYSAPTPSLQGHSAIVEAGDKLNAGKNLTLDFNLNGAMGKQRGIGGGIGAQWLF